MQCISLIELVQGEILTPHVIIVLLINVYVSSWHDICNVILNCTMSN